MNPSGLTLNSFVSGPAREAHNTGLWHRFAWLAVLCCPPGCDGVFLALRVHFWASWVQGGLKSGTMAEGDKASDTQRGGKWSCCSCLRGFSDSARPTPPEPALPGPFSAVASLGTGLSCLLPWRALLSPCLEFEGSPWGPLLMKACGQLSGGGGCRKLRIVTDWHRL